MPITLNGFGNEPIVLPLGLSIRRAQATVTGFQPAVDKQATEVLKELDALLKKRIFPGAAAQAESMLAPKLTARRADVTHKPNVAKWERGSLAATLAGKANTTTDHTLGEVIDTDTNLATLRYGFDQALDKSWNDLDFDIRAVLGYSGVRDLLVIRAATKFTISSQPSLMNFVLNHEEGIAPLLRYTKISAAREYVVEHQLQVKDIDLDSSPAVKALAAAAIGLTEDSLEDEAIAAITAYTESTTFEDVIKAANVHVPTNLRPRLVQYLKASEPPVTKDTAPFMVPMYLARAVRSTDLGSSTKSDDPFAVTFFVDDTTSLQVSTEAVNCAAQLYYVMVLGDELGAFDAVRYFTHRYLFRDGFAVEDPQLRRDLENYVFSEQFAGLDDITGDERMMRCTRPGERRSFYRQVFDQGSEPVPGDGLPNSEFTRLWKILMLESARYLEKAQASPHPVTLVSRQNVMQAVEDLQYNLSTSCVGMATVMTPLMYGELVFVVTRILGHPEVRKHLVPSGGSWLKVVEKLQADQGRRARVAVLNNKSRLGYSLIHEIAGYVASKFEQDAPFSKFISGVDAFITTQAILQEDAEASDASSSGSDAASSSGAGGRYGEGSLPGMPDLSRLPGMPTIPGVSAPWPGTPGGTNASNGSSLNAPHGTAPQAGAGVAQGNAASTGANGASSSSDWDF